MNESRAAPASQRFELSAPAPVRALAISAGAGVAAMVLLVVWGVAGRPQVFAVLGMAVLILALALAVAALGLTRRLRTTVLVKATSVVVVRGRRTRSLAWADIDQVTLQGARLTLAAKPGAGEDCILVNPRDPADPTFGSLLTVVQASLNSDRGYGTGPG